MVADVSVDALLSRTLSSGVVAQAIETISSPGAPVEKIADYLIEQSAGVVSRTGDNYVIPPSVRRLVISIAQTTGVIYDPAAAFRTIAD